MKKMTRTKRNKQLCSLLFRCYRHLNDFVWGREWGWGCGGGGACAFVLSFISSSFPLVCFPVPICSTFFILTRMMPMAAEGRASVGREGQGEGPLVVQQQQQQQQQLLQVSSHHP